jgi:hypothetical protein
MHETNSMRRFNAPTRINEQAHGTSNGKCTFAVQQRSQVLTEQALHHEVGRAVVEFSAVEHAHDVSAPHRSEAARFRAKPLGRPWITA